MANRGCLIKGDGMRCAGQNVKSVEISDKGGDGGEKRAGEWKEEGRVYPFSFFISILCAGRISMYWLPLDISVTVD